MRCHHTRSREPAPAQGSIGRPAQALPGKGPQQCAGRPYHGHFMKKPAIKFLDTIQLVFGFQPPRHHGYDVVDSIKAMYAGQCKKYFSEWGAIFLSATPGYGIYCHAALKKLLAYGSMSPPSSNRSHLVMGKKLDTAGAGPER